MHNLRKLSRLYRLAPLLLAVMTVLVACSVAQGHSTSDAVARQTPSSKAQFQSFLIKFKHSVRTNNVTEIANAINFPFYVYSSSYSRANFLEDKDEKVNFFTGYVRSQILKNSIDDFVIYKNKNEIDSDPSFALIPDKTPVFELDIINNRGGPAMRLMFARTGSHYKLFCLVQ